MRRRFVTGLFALAVVAAGAVAATPRAQAVDLPTVSVGDVRVIEADAGFLVVKVPVNFSGPASVDVKVPYSFGATGDACRSSHLSLIRSHAFHARFLTRYLPRSGDDAGGHRVMVGCGLRAEQRREDVRGQESRRGAYHSAPDVGRETSPGAAQVQRKGSRQVLAKVTELPHDEEAAHKNTRAECAGHPMVKPEVSRWQRDQSGHEKNPQQRPPHEGQRQREHGATAFVSPAFVAERKFRRLFARVPAISSRPGTSASAWRKAGMS